MHVCAYREKKKLNIIRYIFNKILSIYTRIYTYIRTYICMYIHIHKNISCTFLSMFYKRIFNSILKAEQH